MSPKFFTLLNFQIWKGLYSKIQKYQISLGDPVIGVVRRLICWYKSVDNMDFNNIKQPVVTIGHVSPADLIDCLLVFFFLLKN